MKKFIAKLSALCVAILLLVNGTPAQAQTWNWAATAAGIEVASTCSAPVPDGYGNVYIAGCFISLGDSMKFNNSGVVLTDFSPGVYTIFLGKYDKNGVLLWAKCFRSGISDIGGMDVDKNGNIYLAGSYKDSIQLGSTTLTGSPGAYRSFLAKFSTNGSLLWTRHLTASPAGDFLGVTALGLNPHGAIYLAGNFSQDTIVIDNVTLGNSDASSLTYDYFALKLDSVGTAIWGTSGGTDTCNDGRPAMCFDTSGNLYLSTVFNLQGTMATPSQIGIYKFDNNGNLIWTKQGMSALGAVSEDIACDRSGNLYVAGWHGGGTQFDTLQNLTDAGGFLVKYNPAGHAIWARTSKVNDNSVSVFYTGIGIDSSGVVSICGSYTEAVPGPLSQVSFDTFTLSQTIGARDAFLVQYAGNGNAVRAAAIGGNRSEFSSGLAVLPDGTVYYTGSFYSPNINLGNISITNTPDQIGNTYGKFLLARYGAANPTGIRNVSKDFSIDLYPNPTHGMVQVEASAPIKSVRILDQLGRKVYSSELQGTTKSFQFDLGAYPRGLYYVQVQTRTAYRVKQISLY